MYTFIHRKKKRTLHLAFQHINKYMVLGRNIFSPGNVKTYILLLSLFTYRNIFTVGEKGMVVFCCP